MDTLTRLRHAQKRIVKGQRRLWLVQVAFWPTVLLVALAGAAGAVVWYRRRDTDKVAAPVDGLPHL